MDPSIIINKRVDVIASFYTDKPVGLLVFPYKMRFNNREIVFTELGLRHPTKKGTRMVHVFDMSDGTNDYRLEFDAEALTWTLVTMIGGS
ncbi:hypothetical protein KC950_01225 [Candidatus Saccharibacteria bacterium]|nr:hypothetical protein [Candidatus Saccharibacteria bacterium]